MKLLLMTTYFLENSPVCRKYKRWNRHPTMKFIRDDNMKYNGVQQPRQHYVYKALTQAKKQNVFKVSDFPEHFGAFKGRGKTSIACRSHK